MSSAIRVGVTTAITTTVAAIITTHLANVRADVVAIRSAKRRQSLVLSLPTVHVARTPRCASRHAHCRRGAAPPRRAHDHGPTAAPETTATPTQRRTSGIPQPRHHVAAIVAGRSPPPLSLVRRVLRVRPVRRGDRAWWVHQVFPDPRVQSGHRDPQATWARSALSGHRDPLGLKVCKASKDRKDYKVQRGRKAQRDQKAQKDLKARKGPKGRKDQRGRKGPKDRKDHRASHATQ